MKCKSCINGDYQLLGFKSMKKFPIKLLYLLSKRFDKGNFNKNIEKKWKLIVLNIFKIFNCLITNS